MVFSSSAFHRSGKPWRRARFSSSPFGSISSNEGLENAAEAAIKWRSLMKMTVGAAAAFALLAASSAAEAADPAIALVLGVKGSPFYQALACGAKAKAKELGLVSL